MTTWYLIVIGQFVYQQFEEFVSWHLHESEIQGVYYQG